MTTEDLVYRRALGLGLSLALLAAANALAAQEPTGLIVEEVPAGGSLAGAGVEPGDQLLGWRSPGLSGRLNSVFDWWILAHAEAWKYPIQLNGKRRGKRVTFQARRGDWRARLRPVLSPGLESAESIVTLPVDCSEMAGKTWSAFFGRLEPFRAERSALLAWAVLQRQESLARCSSDVEAPVGRADLDSAARSLSFGPQRTAFWALAGESFRAAGRRDLGLEFVRRAQEAWAEKRAAGEAPDLLWASVTFLLSDDLLNKEDLEAAGRQAEAALAATQTLASGSLLEARILWRLGRIRELQGALDASYRHYHDSLDLLETLDVTATEWARTWRNLGIVRAKQGNLKEAQLNLEQALEWGRRIAEPNTLTAGIVNNLGLVAYSRGDLDRAQKFLVEAQRRKVAAAAVGGQDVEPSTLVNLGLIAVEREDYSSAEEFFGEALVILRQQDPESLGMAILLNNLGRAKRLLGGLTEARGHHEEALAIQKRIAPSSLAVSESLERLAQVDEAEGLLDAAAAQYQQAQALRESLAPSTSRNAILLGRMARLDRRRGDMVSASAFFDRAVTLVEERLEDLGGSHEQRQGFRSQFGPLFRDYVEVLAETGRADAAFELQERSRARIFREMLAERDLDLGKSLPEEWAREREALASRYDAIQIEIASLTGNRGGKEALRLDQELLEIRWQREALLEKVRRDSPRLAALKYPRALGLEEIQAALDPGTLLLAFSVNEQGTLAFALSKEERLQVRRLPLGAAQLREEVDGFVSLVQQTAVAASRRAGLRAVSQRAAGQRLFDQLLKPFEARLSRSQRVLLLPDGPLYQLPFAALVRELPSSEPPSREASDRGWQYVAEWKPVHFALSASLYAELRANRSLRPAEWPLVAFGAPLFADREAAGNASAFEGSEPKIQGRPGAEFSALPAARGEVEKIAALFPGSRVYLGDEVTEEQVLELPPKVGLLHFATHVRLDEKVPLDSALVLSAPGREEVGQANGLLQVWEIFESVRVEADMVVLSACESALGKEIQGEGLIGLTRAFHFAGARSVAASLWPVADATTAELMVRFYRQLRLGRPKDEALRAAQLELLEGEAGSEATAPYYWAAFQLSGDWSTGAGR